MNHYVRVLALLAVPSATIAQSVVVTAAALTPATCQVTTATQFVTQTLPVGPLANPGSFGASAPGAGAALLGWSSTATATEASFTLATQTRLDVPGFAQLGPGEVLVTFTGISPNPMAVRFEAKVEQLGVSFAQTAIDVGNDGTIDWNGAGLLQVSAADIVAQPLQLRVVFTDTRAVVDASATLVRLRVVPDGIHVLRVPANCGLPSQYTAAALFDTSIADLEIRSTPIAWHVLGLQTQPVLLPPSLTLTAAPCILVPSPDLVLRTGTIFLPVPQSVRPLMIHAQTVDFANGGLRVSDSLQIAVF